ncbi:hypothetical protein [Ornithinimicrobium cryptoxanthini]|uniref:hypothetical protein n=1 Tax=Ornithinimicrobium cryptoxanthini TaxID=2934161 RepID=UPI0021195A87|nr:hypothetical protein [Ornithinimicrobium cryptoxanthini]
MSALMGDAQDRANVADRHGVLDEGLGQALGARGRLLVQPCRLGAVALDRSGVWRET